MGTRHFCDQCGNTVTDLSTMTCFELRQCRRNDFDDDDEDENRPLKRRKAEKRIDPIDVELCQNCVDTWLARFKKLTEHTK